jgi:hypothetical protein
MLFNNGSSSGHIRTCFSRGHSTKKAVTKYEEYRCKLQARVLHNTEKKLEACMKLHNVYKNLPNPLLNELITIENLYNILYHCGE